MGTSVRTLTRRLHGYDVTYGKLIDKVRFNMAKEQLQQPGMRIGDIAHYVGFNDQSDFGRMICRVSGLTPTKLRRSLMSEGEKSLTTAGL
jgi:AraC-like DNA-binding protein